MTKVVDPVCGMTIDAETAPDKHRVGDETYYFCAKRCGDKFRSDPQWYLTDEQGARQESCCGHDRHDAAKFQSRSAPPAASKYTCPMHPEIEQDHPGSCPKCGMALEPKTVSAEEDDSELRDMTRRFWVASVLTAPLFFLAM
ncbi:MAG: YHS domain-containing protein, partial [Planctomycetaceae bacterium]|nr:YHS domain-containing protein [Planctomycetaceae bacterium]